MSTSSGSLRERLKFRMVRPSPSPIFGNLCVPVKISTMMIRINRPVIPPMWHLAYAGLLRLRVCRVNSRTVSVTAAWTVQQAAAAPALQQASPGLNMPAEEA